jgi:signal transduction histidine kinase
MEAFLQSVILFVIVIYGLSMIYAKVRLSLEDKSLMWFYGVAVTGGLVSLAYLMSADANLLGVDRRIGIIASNILLIGVVGAVIFLDTLLPSHRKKYLTLWALVIPVWLILAIFTGESIAGQSNWYIKLLSEADFPALATIGGYVVANLLTLGYVFWRFYRAGLPEVANRMLFWILINGCLALGVLGTMSAIDLFVSVGLLINLGVALGVLYALKYHHVFDVRLVILNGFRIILFIFLATLIVGVALNTALDRNPQDDAQRLVLIGSLAVLTALAYVMVRQISEHIIRLLTQRSVVDPAQSTREYSQLIAEVTELDALVPSATREINRLLAVKSSCIIVLNQTSDIAVNFLVMQPDSPNDKRRGQVALTSELYMVLAKYRRPLLQFDIEFAPRYQGIAENERQFFRSLGMSAYAPITLDHAMVGILAVGAKLNDTAYYASDLELLATFAQQTGVALRNTRLLEDLQHLNKSMRVLNQKLKSSNEQLSRMDSVKSDFVTIASHELRTPLAQIRGYSDIMDALNEQGILDPEQTNNLITNLRKATERMEELISAMLDVSQLDVEAMDLRFAQASIESLIKMSIEPMTDAIRQRKLTLSARGLRGLPNVQADLQRLVQAFRNVIANAIKFTPDGGKIDIIASLQQAENEDEIDHIMIQIRDTGVGIDRANLEMIFKKFFRAYDPSLHSTGSYKFLGAGPGLGLTITRGVIEGHGGKIWAESSGHDMELFPGSTFNIVLPVITPEGARRVLTFEGPAASEALTDRERTTDHERTQPFKQGM